MKLVSFNKSTISTIDFDIQRNMNLEAILKGELNISTICSTMVAETKSQVCAVVLISSDKPFNIVFSTNPAISFCQSMPLLSVNDQIIISNNVVTDPRNGDYFTTFEEVSERRCSLPDLTVLEKRRRSSILEYFNPSPLPKLDEEEPRRSAKHSFQQSENKCPIEKMCTIPIKNNDTVYGKIILANRKKGYSKNTIESVSQHIANIISIIISNDDNIIFNLKSNPQVVFLSSLSHEIRTPIHGIANMISLLSTVGTLNEKQKKYISCALSSCEDLIETVADAIDYQKIKNNSLGIVNDSFDLREVLDKTIELVQFKADQKSIYLNLIIDESVPHIVYGDKDRIKQVLLNVIGNAIKFTNKGGVTIKVNQYPGKIIFSIMDTGCGIKKDNLSQIFTEYYQEEKYSKNGLGLGLSLSKKLIQMMGGGISVESVFGQGSTFTIDLPLAEERYYLDFSSSDDDAQISVLIIDPVENNRIILRKFLKQWKIEVETCASYKEGKKLLDYDAYDIIIINPAFDIGEAFSICHFVESKYSTTRLISIGNEQYSIFDEAITDISNKQDVYNILLSARKRRKSTMVASNKISRICIVEDDDVSAFALKEILVSKGIEEKNITVIDNGEEAVREILHNRYDLILLDCKLKGDMNGIMATQIIKSSPCNVKIIGMTASITEQERQTWLGYGIDSLILKPFTSNAVIKVLNL